MSGLISELQEELLTAQQRTVDLQAGVGMLGSAVIRHMNMHNRLISVNKIYKQQVAAARAQEKELLSLTVAISSPNNNKKHRHTFRSVALLVIAANRLQTLSKQQNQIC